MISFIIQTPDHCRRNRLSHVKMIKPYYSPGSDGGGSQVPRVGNVALPVLFYQWWAALMRMGWLCIVPHHKGHGRRKLSYFLLCHTFCLIFLVTIMMMLRIYFQISLVCFMTSLLQLLSLRMTLPWWTPDPSNNMPTMFVLQKGSAWRTRRATLWNIEPLSPAPVHGVCPVCWMRSRMAVQDSAQPFKRWTYRPFMHIPWHLSTTVLMRMVLLGTSAN